MVRTALHVAPVGGDRSALLATIDNLIVVGDWRCGCASVDFQEPPGFGKSMLVADAVGKTADGIDLFILVWGNDLAITGLEISDCEDESARRIPLLDSVRPFHSPPR